MRKKQLSREDIARKEIGYTDISRNMAAFLMISFLFIICSVPLVQVGLDRGRDFGPFFRLPPAESLTGRSEDLSLPEKIDRLDKKIIQNMRKLETSLEEGSFLRKLFLPPLQYLFLQYLGQGNEKVVAGSHEPSFLFYTAALDYLTGQPFLNPDQLEKRATGHEIWERAVQPDPVAAIVHFRDQLAARSIELLVVPIPVKAGIEPERLVAKESFVRPLHNRSWSRFMEKLSGENITVFDAGAVLVDYSRKKGGAFLQYDTHWQPGAMEAVAGELAGFIKETYTLPPGKNDFSLQPVAVRNTGDLARMLTLPESMTLLNDQEVVVNQVLGEDGGFVKGDPESPVLLLGDSFTNIFSFRGLHWSFAGGLAEHLGYRLGQLVDCLARNDSGAYATRELLAADLARGRDRLAGKRLVIWEFSERELSSGDWKILSLDLQEPVDAGFFTVPAGEKTVVAGLVASISSSPKPGSVPYIDNLITVHLVDLHGRDGKPIDQDQALVYGWGMRNNELMPLATVRPGDEIRLTLSPWEEKEGEYGGFRRSPLVDEMIELETPNWGELINDE
ncbi:alginate O-acetyltransferase AlgX-related protein [Desulfomarina sp.]